jgi:hypothetical protein
MNISEVKEVKYPMKRKVLNRKGEEVEKTYFVTVGIKVSFDDIRHELEGVELVEQDGKPVKPAGTWIMFSYEKWKDVKDDFGEVKSVKTRDESFTIHYPSSPAMDPNSMDTDQWGRFIRGTGRWLLTNKRNQPLCKQDKTKGMSLREFSKVGISAIVIPAIEVKMAEIEAEAAERAAA